MFNIGACVCIPNLCVQFDRVLTILFGLKKLKSSFHKFREYRIFFQKEKFRLILLYIGRQVDGYLRKTYSIGGKVIKHSTTR